VVGTAVVVKEEEAVVVCRISGNGRVGRGI
jgi:hypothetical protein